MHKLCTALYADKIILYFNEDSGYIVFSSNEMGILNIDLNNINLGNNFAENDPDPCYIKFKKRKELKKEINEGLITTAWHMILLYFQLHMI